MFVSPSSEPGIGGCEAGTSRQFLIGDVSWAASMSNEKTAGKGEICWEFALPSCNTVVYASSYSFTQVPRV